MKPRGSLVTGLFALCCACAPPQPQAETAATLSSSSESSGTESESEDGPVDMGMPPVACSTEWDCGVGERCQDNVCVCVGCACAQGVPAPPLTVDEPFEEPEIKVELARDPDECDSNADCGPLQYCDGLSCVESTECVEDIDCYEDWPEEHRFCIDNLCQPIDCLDDLDCPVGSLCDGAECKWIATLPDCVNVPSFEELIADTLITPESSAFVILDLDADGRDDLAVLDDGAVHWVLSTGVGFAAPTPWAGEPGAEPIGLGRGDIHGDGVDELLIGHQGVSGIEILVVGQAGPQYAEFIATLETPTIPTTIDVDYDGLPDLVSGTAIDGPTTLIEAQLGDGTGTFASLWTSEELEPFDWIGPFASMDAAPVCERALATGEADLLGARRLDHQMVEPGTYGIIGRPTEGQMIFDETPTHPPGILATVALDDAGVLYVHQAGLPYQLIVALSPAPTEVVLASPGGLTVHAIIDHGADPAEFVEFSGRPLSPVCRGNLEFALDVDDLGVGDFDGDGREDLLGRGSDGALHVWYARE